MRIPPNLWQPDDDYGDEHDYGDDDDDDGDGDGESVGSGTTKSRPTA